MTEAERNIVEQIKSNPMLCEDVEFMRNAIEVNERFIVYDRTEDDSVYLTYIRRKKESLKRDEDRNKRLIECFEKIEQELLEPSEVEEGMYKIPHKFLFERIIRSEKDRELPASFDLNQYFMLDGRYSKEFGETLQGLYDNPDYIFGIHGTSAIVQKEDIDRVLSEGLRATTQGRGPGHLGSHVYYGENIDFIQALSFVRNSVNLAETMFILQIPRSVFDGENPTPLYGSNSMILDQQAHILPEYMYGYMQRKASREYETSEQQMFDRTIYRSDVTPQKYKFGFREITVDDSKIPVALAKKDRDEDKTIE